MRVALVGNPNSGKTTLFNGITGNIEKVGNWPGVTVAKKQGAVKKQLLPSQDEAILVIDLPGAYSMSPYTQEESITRKFVLDEKPDVIINIIDATNLGRSLFLTSQILEMAIPTVIALNKSDLNKSKENKIDSARLAELLKCPVVETTATAERQNGFRELIAAAKQAVGSEQSVVYRGERASGTDEESLIAQDRQRYDFVKDIVNKVEQRSQSSQTQSFQDSVDRVVANRWLGIPIFFLVMWAVFSLSQESVGPYFADLLVGWLESFQEMAAGWIGQDVSPLLSSLLIDGIIGGVIAVVGFLPLIMVLFFMLALLEDSGYMARVAVVMDRHLKRVGLSGKTIIPMLVSTGCAIPGIMATRTIKNVRQRRTTAMLSPFMPCGAKLPVIALFAGVFFMNASWVGTLMYFLAILVIIIGALIVKQITGAGPETSFFILELPEYRWPSIKRALLTTFSRAKAFIIKAGTIILICNAVVQVMQTFNWQFEVVAENAADTSILASIASPFALVFIPLGFGMWQLAAAAITGFIAKENVVGTLAVVYGITNFIDTEALELVGGSTEVASIMGISSVAALAYLVFNLFTPPCFAAIGAMNSEMENRKWLFAGVGFQLGMGYTCAFLFYQLGMLFTTGHLGEGFLFGLAIVAVYITVIVSLIMRTKRQDHAVALTNSSAK